ncbi:MAG: hypothetical protein HEP71_33570 [Roseivirga sp.]|nr:hypothetical protein [Roseivirga sp.]
MDLNKLHTLRFFKIVFSGFLFSLCLNAGAQTVLYTEDFEGTVGTTYTVSPAFDEDLVSASFLLEEQWMNGAVISTGDGPYFTGESGSKIIYAKEIAEVANAINGNEAQLTTNSIDITGYTNLDVSFLLASHFVAAPGLKLYEGPGETGASTAQDLMTVEYKIGSGSWTKLMEFTGRDCDDNNDDAGNLYQDTDLDGTASDECSNAAAAVGTTFKTFSDSFTNSGGTSLSVRFRFISDDFQEGYALDLVKVSAADNLPPVVQSIAPTGSPAANASSMNFLVTFDENASAVTDTDFTLTKTNTANGSIGTPTTSDGGTTWTVPITSITGDGSLRLDLNASTDIVDASGNGNGTNGSVAAFSSGTSHTVDLVAPTVTSIVRSNPTDASTNATSVTFRVTFSEDVSSITIADFAISGAGSGGTASLSGFSTITGSSVFDLTVSTLNTDGELDLDFSGSEDITDSNGNDFAQVISSEQTYTMSFAPSSVTMDITVFLEGAFNGATLNTTLNGSLPTAQPYSGSSFNNHSGTESATAPGTAVDWVLVELREAGSAAGALASTKVGSAAGFLMNDGSIKATDGTSNLTVSLSGNSGASFYVVIYHRNHLPIMSANAISESSGTYSIDFTSSSANTYQTTSALASLTGGKFAMIAGDADGDGDVDATDLTTWRNQNGDPFVYNSTNGDFNLDGAINAVDRNDFQQKNVTKTSQVPTT